MLTNEWHMMISFHFVVNHTTMQCNGMKYNLKHSFLTLEKVVYLDENSWTHTKLIKPLFRWPSG